jgi:putative effector of murein hydrolase
MMSQSEVPSWLRIVGWIALLEICLSVFLPGLRSLNIFFGFVGMAVLSLAVFHAKQTIFPSPLLRWAWLLFLLSCLFSIVIPNLQYLPDWQPLSKSLREFFTTFQAMVAAGLILLLIRKKIDLCAFLFLLTGMALMVATAVPVSQWVNGQLADRTGGTRSTFIYASLMFLACITFALLGASQHLRNTRTPSWTLPVAGGMLLLVPFLVFRKSWSGMIDSGSATLWGSTFLGITLIVGSASLAGFLYFWFSRNPGKLRIFAAGTGGALACCNIIINQSRSAQALIVLLLLALIPFWSKRKWQAILIIVLLLATGLTTFHLNTRFESEATQRALFVRRGIRQGSWNMFKERPLLGSGYGCRAFQRHWIPPAPEGLADSRFPNRRFSNAHNLWLHLLATQGVCGWLSFHFLFIVVLWMLLQRLRVHRTKPSSAITPIAFQHARTVSGIAIITIVLLQAHGLLDHPLRNGIEVLYWAVAAIGLAIRPTSTSQEHHVLHCPHDS